MDLKSHVPPRRWDIAPLRTRHSQLTHCGVSQQAAKHAAFRVWCWNYSWGYPKCCRHLGFGGKHTQRKPAAPSTPPGQHSSWGREGGGGGSRGQRAPSWPFGTCSHSAPVTARSQVTPHSPVFLAGTRARGKPAHCPLRPKGYPFSQGIFSFAPSKPSAWFTISKNVLCSISLTQTQIKREVFPTIYPFISMVSF